ncbi:hypothetical protein MPC4_10185 [Methylocella tundrae]|uniref:Uncharacterized protein n=1 Tax=Methylocella tundrae TaxID=227605 RepID=A0A8B6M0K2_METTU|nr:hypothetical protein MPC1_4770002 [Methylocella tundrae]VTZ48235.1 hypothetical protein MPC4_10185 [Methylocella tundrae]
MHTRERESAEVNPVKLTDFLSFDEGIGERHEPTQNDVD